MIRCVAIDDEPRALEIIQSHVDRVDDVELVKTFVDPVKAISFVNANVIDFVLLDIEMPEITGLEVAKNLNRDTLIVFTTAHSEYAVASYDFAAVDYLLKPFDLSRFLATVAKVRDRLTTSPETTYVFVDTGNQKKKIMLDELAYVESQGNYVSYVTTSDKSLVRSSMKDVLELLPSKAFVQVHRSFVVAIDKIEKIEDNHVYLGGRGVSIGATHREKFWKVIGFTE